MSACETETMRMPPGVPAGARTRPPTVRSLFRCTLTIWPACDDFDEIGSSVTKSRPESKGKTLPDGAGNGDGDVPGDDTGAGVGEIGNALALPAPVATQRRKSALLAS